MRAGPVKYQKRDYPWNGRGRLVEPDENFLFPLSDQLINYLLQFQQIGQRSEILASGVYPQLPVLMCESGQLCGQTYNQAQGVFAVKSFPQPDGRVRLELAPELQHDQPRQRWVGGQGMLRLEASRPKREFDDMTLSTDLAPGAMLVLSSLPNRPGSLGHHFFTESEGGRREQKLLIVRLSQTQHDGLFNPPEPLKLEDQTP